MVYRGWGILFAAASGACALFFLLSQESLLLALRFLKSCHEAAFLFGFGGVLTHCFTHLFFANNLTEDVGLDDGDEQ